MENSNFAKKEISKKKQQYLAHKQKIVKNNNKNKKTFIRLLFLPLENGVFVGNLNNEIKFIKVELKINLNRPCLEIIKDIMKHEFLEIHFKHLKIYSDDILKKIITFHHFNLDENFKPRSVYPNLLNNLDNSIIHEELELNFEISSFDFLMIYPKNEISINNTIFLKDKKKNVPVVWMDIDGVINILASEFYDENLENPDELETLEKFWPDYKRQTFYGPDFQPCTITWSPKIISKLNEISQFAEFYFLTTWEVQAKYRIAPFIGLNDFDMAPFSKNDLFEEKTISSLDNSMKERPFVWIDDHIMFAPNLVAGRENVEKHFTGSKMFIAPDIGFDDGNFRNFGKIFENIC